MKYLKIKNELREGFTRNGICIFSIEFDNEQGYIDVVSFDEKLQEKYNLESLDED